MGNGQHLVVSGCTGNRGVEKSLKSDVIRPEHLALSSGHACFFGCLSSESNPVERVGVDGGRHFLWLCLRHRAEMRDELENSLKSYADVEVLRSYSAEVDRARWGKPSRPPPVNTVSPHQIMGKGRY